MNGASAIRAQALLAVLKPDQDYEVRRILRWYSKTFFTPLPVVEEMPFDDVLRDYFECHFEEMEEDALEQIRLDLIETDEDRNKRLRAIDEEKADADEYARIVRQEEEVRERTKASKKAAAPATLPTPKPQPMLSRSTTKESELPSVPASALPPDISMSFMSDAEFEDEINGLGAMKQPLK